MDPHSRAQDVHRCDLCETPEVHSYCDLCHVNLCKPCILEHISDEYDKHKIVPFKKRKSTLIYPKCATHQLKNCELHCNNCHTFVCSSCTASKKHKGHTFVEVTEVYKTKKEVIKKDTKELENHISPMYEEIALDLEIQLANLDKGYEKLTTIISKQGEQLQREIDIIINKMKSEIGEIKVKHGDILKKHLDEIKQVQSLIKQTRLALWKIEKSTDIYPTIEYSSEIRKFQKLPSKVHIPLPIFIPKPITRENLCRLIGQITPLFATKEEHALPTNQPNTAVRKLLGEPELVTTIQTENEDLRSVSCLNEDKIWTSGLFNDIKCFNIKGVLFQTINQTSENYSNDIAIDNEGNLFCIYGETGTVNKVKYGRTEALFTLQGWVPLNLCVTSTGHLLVTMFSYEETQSKVVRYSGSTEIQTIQYDIDGEPLYSGNCRIKYITENRNHDICVADCGADAVVVVNQDEELRWRYTGHPLVSKNKPFRPFGITADSQSRILTADGVNNSIHILDENGEFLCFIDNCDLDCPWGICVDNNDNLYVCEFFKGNVKQIKYLG